MDQTRENVAINAYLKLLQSRGANQDLLKLRTFHLKQLSVHLQKRALDGNEYREAVDALMEMTAVDDWHTALTTAREFYPFWISDIKAIAVLNDNRCFDIKTMEWKPLPTSLQSLVDSLETEKFDTSENWSLKAYTQALRQEGSEQSLVNTRVKLAKLLLIRLKNAPSKDNKSYRAAVDLTLPLFSIRKSRRLFLVVVREFYHFWSGNPDASSMVLKDGSGNLLF